MAERDTVIMGQPLPREEFLALQAKKVRRRLVLLSLGIIAGAGLVAFAAPRILDSGPTAEEHVAQARAFLAEGKEQAAAIALRNSLQQAPENGEARWMLAELLVKLGDPSGALKEAERARQFGLPVDTRELELQAMMLQGRQAEVLGRLATTERVEESARLLTLRGRAASALGKDQAAAESFRAALSLEPSNSEARLGAAALSFKRGAWEDTLAELDAVLAQAPREGRAWAMRGEVLLRRGDLPGAGQAFAQADRVARDEGVGAKLGRVRVALARGEAQAAEAIIAPLAASHPKSPPIQYWRAVTAGTLGDIDAAKTAYQVVLSAEPDHRASQLGLAALYYGERQLDEAESVLGPLHRELQTHPGVAKLLAVIQLGLDRPAEAVATLQPLNPEGSEDPQLLAILGNAHLRLRELDRGTALLARAAELAPDAAGIHTQLALGSLASGRRSQAMDALETAVALEPELVQAETLLVLAHLQSGNAAAAIAAARRFLERAPENPAAHNLLGGALQSAGQVQAARSAYERAAGLEPTSADAQLNLARLDRAAGHDGSARRRYEQVIAEHPEHPAALTALAGLEVADGNRSEAVRLLERASERNPRAVHPRLALARLYLWQGEAEEALVFAEEANALAPARDETLLLLARAQSAAGLGEAARLKLERLADRRPQDSEVQLALGAVRQRLGDLEGARAAYRRAMTLDAESVAALAALAGMDIQSGQLDRALERAEALARKHPGRPEGPALAGDVHLARDEPRRALLSYLRAHAVAPSGRLIVAQARALHALGNTDSASALMQEWLKQHPDDRPVRQSAAEMSQRAGRYAQAAASYEALLAEDPKNVGVLNNLAWLYLDDAPAKALALAQRAREIAPDHPAVLDTLGWVLLRSGEKEQAAALLRRSAAQAPTSEHRYHYAAALAGTGRAEEAVELLRLALSQSRDFPGRANAAELLDSLQRSGG